MARLAFTGYEMLTGDGDSAANKEIAIVHSGAFSMKHNSGAGNSASTSTVGGNSNVPNSNATYVWFVRGYYYFIDYPASKISIMESSGWSVGFATSQGAIAMDSGGNLYATIGGQTSGASSSVVPKNTWVRLEYKITVVIVASTSRQVTVNDVLIDGISQSLTATSTLLTATPGTAVASFILGWANAPGANKVCYTDDAAWNDDSGINQNSYPGSGKTVLLLPISTNAAAAKWTDNDGTQTNMWEGVNNTPPTGTAATTTPSHLYIKHAGGAAGTTDAFDANMTNYSAAGLIASDTINVIQFVEADGEEASTGTKLLNFEVLSNPVIASPGNVTAGDGAGAQGTFSMNWAIHRSAMTYSPVVTLGTSPVMRARRPETATRVASVCFMGIYVDYTPATTFPSSDSDFIPAKSSQIVSVNRASFY